MRRFKNIASRITYKRVNNTFKFVPTLPKLNVKGSDSLKEKKELNINIGSRIRRARTAAGLTQEQFAELIGMGTKNISAIERGAVGISISALQKICRLLRISSDEILFDTEKKNNVQALASRLEQLNSKQFEIISDIVNKVLEAFNITTN